MTEHYPSNPTRNMSTGVIALLLISSFILQGCMFWPNPNYGTSAFWHQPDVVDALQQKKEFVDYSLHDFGGHYLVNRDIGENHRETLAVTDQGDVRYTLISPARIDPKRAFDQLNDTFDALKLPSPILNESYIFSGRNSRTFALWEQPQIWPHFPNESRAGFTIFVQDSLKVAQRINARTSEWIRTDTTGNVSFRFEERDGWMSEYRHSINETHTVFNRSEVVHDRMIEAFHSLEMPVPTLRDDYDFRIRPWDIMDSV